MAASRPAVYTELHNAMQHLCGMLRDHLLERIDRDLHHDLKQITIRNWNAEIPIEAKEATATKEAIEPASRETFITHCDHINSFLHSDTTSAIFYAFSRLIILLAEFETSKTFFQQNLDQLNLFRDRFVHALPFFTKYNSKEKKHVFHYDEKNVNMHFEIDIPAAEKNNPQEVIELMTIIGPQLRDLTTELIHLRNRDEDVPSIRPAPRDMTVGLQRFWRPSTASAKIPDTNQVKQRGFSDVMSHHSARINVLMLASAVLCAQSAAPLKRPIQYFGIPESPPEITSSMQPSIVFAVVLELVSNAIEELLPTAIEMNKLPKTSVEKSFNKPHAPAEGSLIIQERSVSESNKPKSFKA